MRYGAAKRTPALGVSGVSASGVRRDGAVTYTVKACLEEGVPDPLQLFYDKFSHTQVTYTVKTCLVDTNRER